MSLKLVISILMLFGVGGCTKDNKQQDSSDFPGSANIVSTQNSDAVVQTEFEAASAVQISDPLEFD